MNALQNRRSLWQSWCGISAWECLGWQYSPCCAWPFPAWPIAATRWRTAGLLLLSYLVWLAGSFRIPFSRPTIWIVVGALVIMGLLLAYRQRGELSREFRYRWRYYLLVEGFSWLFSSSICSSVMETLTCGTPTMAARSPWTSPSSTPS